MFLQPVGYLNLTISLKTRLLVKLKQEVIRVQDKLMIMG